MTRLSPKAITEASMEELPKGNLDTRFSNRIAFGLEVKYSESIYIPQIEKLQGEIELLTAREDEHLKDKELLNDEINKLTAKHERLVKGLKELKRFVINEGEFGQFSWTAVDADDMNLLLTEEGNV